MKNSLDFSVECKSAGVGKGVGRALPRALG